MAERGAHLTTSTQSKPSIFEVIAQESLSKTLHPVTKHFFEVLATTRPHQLGWLVKWFEEIYLLLNVFIQQSYLKRKGASFSESFYGLQRLSLSNGKTVLSRKQFISSILLLTLFPYLKQKLEALAVKFKLEVADGIPENTKYPKGTRSIVIHTHNLFHITWEGLVLIQYLRYMSGNSHTHSPILKLIGLTLCYAPEENNISHWLNLKNNLQQGNLKSVPFLLLKLFGSATYSIFEVATFFLQFLQHWHSENKESDIDLPIPPPPKTLPNASQFSNLCPICLGKRSIATVLPVSGFVFCYQCITQYIEENGKCPVTKYPASIDDIIRLY